MFPLLSNHVRITAIHVKKLRKLYGNYKYKIFMLRFTSVCAVSFNYVSEKPEEGNGTEFLCS